MRCFRGLRQICLLVIACAASVSGCSKSSVPMASATGKVWIDGQPVTSGQVTFIPVDQSSKAGLSTGKIESNGEYKILTDGKSGAPLGRYKVTVTPVMMPSADGKAPSAAYNSKFQNPRDTTVTIEVLNDLPEGGYPILLTK
jgi:hypothetical protein